MKYAVKLNSCGCHPETCCCNDWKVVSPNGETHSTYFYESIALEVAEALNRLYGYSKEKL